jgi:hypothetical protein
MKLIEMIRVPTSTAERIPPRLSTGSVVSLTWLGTNRNAITKNPIAATTVTPVNGASINATTPSKNIRPEGVISRTTRAQ